MSALTDVAKQAMEYFCDRGSVDTYSEEWGFYLALRDALAQEPNPQMREKSLGTENSAGMDALRAAMKLEQEPNNPGECSECHAPVGSVCSDVDCPGKAALSRRIDAAREGS